MAISWSTRLSKPFLVLRRWVLTALTFAIFHVGSGFISWILIPRLLSRVAKLPQAEQRGALDRFFLARDRWIVSLLVRFRLFDFKPPTLPPWLAQGGPYMVVCNHPTLVDVLLLRASIPGLTSVVKSSLFNRWYIAPMLRAGGDFPGPTSQSDATFGQTAVLDLFVNKLKSGRSVLVFPEGTRSPAWGLGRFRRGAIEAAIRANVPILPLFLAVDPPVLTKEDTFAAIGRRRALARIEILEPIHVSGDSAQLTRELHAFYEAKIQGFHQQCTKSLASSTLTATTTASASV